MKKLALNSAEVNPAHGGKYLLGMGMGCLHYTGGPRLPLKGRPRLQGAFFTGDLSCFTKHTISRV